MKIDKKLIKELSEYLDEFKLTEIEFTEKDTKIKVSKNNISISNQNAPVVDNINATKEKYKSIKKKYCWHRNNISNNWHCISCS